MSESQNFIEEFKALIQQNKAAQAENEKLRIDRQGLEKELVCLSKKAEALKKEEPIILANIEQAKQQSLKQIVEYKANTDRVFSQENDRIERKSDELNKRESSVIKTETYHKQKSAELIEWEDKLDKKEQKLKDSEISLKCLQDQVEAQKNDNEVKVIYIEQKLAIIASENISIFNDREWIKREQLDLSESLKKLNEGIDNLNKANEAFSKKEVSFNQEKDNFEKTKDKFLSDHKDIDLKIDLLKKQKKDLDDKENALKAMSLDIDLKIAKLESGKK